MVFRSTGRLGVFGLGYEDLSEALGAGLSWRIAGILLIAKLITTVACYGSGGCGGIFSPMLFLGGMVGVVVSGVADHAMLLSKAEHVTLAVVGMSCCLGAVVRAPVTGILIVFEMTHEFSLVPPLMLAALISQPITRKLCRLNFYDSILQLDGHEIERLVPPRDLRSWQHLPVSTIANFRPVTLDSLDPALMAAALKETAFRCYPVLQEGQVAGVIDRDEMEQSLIAKRPPRLEPAVRVSPTETIRKVQSHLIESSHGFVLITDGNEGRLLGIITLHDLLRAELSAAERATE